MKTSWNGQMLLLSPASVPPSRSPSESKCTYNRFPVVKTWSSLMHKLHPKLKNALFFLTREFKRVDESMFDESFIISFLKYQSIYFSYVISREPVA